MNLRSFAAAFAALLVVACGGSKKSSTGHVAAHDVAYAGPTTPVTIHSVNDAVATVTSTLSGVGSVSGNTSTFISVGGVSAAVPTLSVADAARLAVQAAPRLAAGQVSGATISGSQPCDVSGSISGTITAADTNNPFRNTGDSGTLTFSNCVNTGSTASIDGTISIVINSSNGVDFLRVDPTTLTAGVTYSATITFTDLSTADVGGYWSGMDGNITMTVKRTVSPNEIEHSISGTGLVFGVGQGTHLLDGTMLTAPTGHNQYLQDEVEVYGNGFLSPFTSTRETLNSKVCSTEMHGCVQVVTNSAIVDVVGDSHPSGGSFTISAGNAMIRFDIQNNTTVNVTYDLDTTAAPPATGPIAQTWACLDANTCTWP